jgi:hypothetical protein
MQGLWKENVGSWNNKDSKRKKQNRKHTLKDKAKWHISHSSNWRNKKESPSTSIEGDIEITEDMVKVKKELCVGVYIIEVDNYNYSKTLGKCFGVLPDGFFEGNTKTAFKYHNRYYDIYTKELIKGIIKPLNKIDVMYLDWDKDLPDVEERVWKLATKPDTRTTIFLYGKPLPVNYWHIFCSYSTKTKKYAQKQVNRMNRQRTREFISKAEWDKDIKIHTLSESILLEIW